MTPSEFIILNKISYKYVVNLSDTYFILLQCVWFKKESGQKEREGKKLKRYHKLFDKADNVKKD